MRIGIVGGLARMQPHLARVAAERGHDVAFHDGRLRGRGVESLERLVGRCAAVVVVTDVNSHGALHVARRVLRERRRAPPLLARRCGLAALSALLASLDGAERAGRPG